MRRFYSSAAQLFLSEVITNIRCYNIYPYLANISDNEGDILKQLLFSCKTNDEMLDKNELAYVDDSEVTPALISPNGFIDFFKMTPINIDATQSPFDYYFKPSAEATKSCIEEFKSLWAKHTKALKFYGGSKEIRCILVEIPYPLFSINEEVLDFLYINRNEHDINYVIFHYLADKPCLNIIDIDKIPELKEKNKKELVYYG